MSLSQHGALQVELEVICALTHSERARGREDVTWDKKHRSARPNGEEH